MREGVERGSRGLEQAERNHGYVLASVSFSSSMFFKVIYVSLCFFVMSSLSPVLHIFFTIYAFFTNEVISFLI